MLLWIVVAVVALAVLAFAFWPRQRGVVDGEVAKGRRDSRGKAEQYNNRSGPNFSGPI